MRTNKGTNTTWQDFTGRGDGLHLQHIGWLHYMRGEGLILIASQPLGSPGVCDGPFCNSRFIEVLCQPSACSPPVQVYGPHSRFP